jgi:hypothetical protein
MASLQFFMDNRVLSNIPHIIMVSTLSILSHGIIILSIDVSVRHVVGVVLLHLIWIINTGIDICACTLPLIAFISRRLLQWLHASPHRHIHYRSWLFDVVSFMIRTWDIFDLAFISIFSKPSIFLIVWLWMIICLINLLILIIIYPLQCTNDVSLDSKYIIFTGLLHLLIHFNECK